MLKVISCQAFTGAALLPHVEGSLAVSEFSDKIRTIGYLSRGRTGSTERTGREHPDSGKPYKAVTDEQGNIVTEHSDPGSGVSCRQDVEIRPAAVEGRIGIRMGS
jgi:hypothetical protein